ncbi:MAG: hypothetical protein A2X19_08235 [Bacteroidetes bacterium GWE2_39_28]|nr:MAG: hypothetical protein A2X19_08235 [Bacteroidetes bacterium GWE2_39_28]OFY13264.1 MAG: hypothetical protein A2X16_05070 [Bacteroidetes bacterium GWF2_39_10]OFZ11449.1 MAG: hypothetical protein A2465_04215 [Bacteroidetes bacterium RIFOXYC2_FULL_39_11]HCT94075.1 hypothetical protein [Rikenellaceae bacterium]
MKLSDREDLRIPDFKMQKFALIGKNVSKSLSPALFSAAYPNSDQTYGLIESDDAAKALDIFLSHGYKGANITSPYKESFMDFSDFHDEISQKIGVTNLILNSNGKLTSYNTDYYGVKDPLTARGLKVGKAVVAGAGGAARAAVLALKDLGMEVTVVNRTYEKAETLAKQFNVSYQPLEQISDLLKNSQLLIYTIDEPLMGLDTADFRNLTIFEANYKNPNLNSKKCIEYISGKEWLVSQAIPSFMLFTGIKPDLKAMQMVAVNC